MLTWLILIVEEYREITGKITYLRLYIWRDVRTTPIKMWSLPKKHIFIIQYIQHILKLFTNEIIDNKNLSLLSKGRCDLQNVCQVNMTGKEIKKICRDISMHVFKFAPLWLMLNNYGTINTERKYSGTKR